MIRPTWRTHAAMIIAAVIENVGRSDMKALRAALREAYPYGERRMHPYRIWCDEIRVQLGKRKWRGPRAESTQPQDLFQEPTS